MRSLNVAISHLKNKPLEHSFNILVIAVVIALVAIILTINSALNNFEKHNISFPQIAVYLKVNANRNDVSSLEAGLNHQYARQIIGYQFISKTDALNSLQQDQQLKQIASDVNATNNPLPDVLLITTNIASSDVINTIAHKIKNMSMVDDVDLDNTYVNKLSDLIAFTRISSHILQIAFIAIFILVIYNMIRLQMMLRQDEILISRMLGASDGFIIAPLMVYAATQVLCSGVLALILVEVFVKFIDSIFLQLNNLFGSAFMLASPSLLDVTQGALILVVFTVFAVLLAVRWVLKHGYA